MRAVIRGASVFRRAWTVVLFLLRQFVGAPKRLRRPAEAALTGGVDGAGEPTEFRLRRRRRWVDTGITIRPGQAVTVTAHGDLILSRLLGISLPVASTVQFRVGTGAVQACRGAATDLDTSTGGRLLILVVEPGLLADESGQLDLTVPRLPLRGSVHLSVIRWADTSARRGAQQPIPVPTGWSHHPRVGASQIYSEHGNEIVCRTHRDAGILRFPVDVAIDEDLHFSWSWLVDRLPSSLAEDTFLTHDYLSTALEFDDGRDLTWMWSSQLAQGTVFRCPLPWWKSRETHYVVRSGRDGLGHWQNEDRAVLRDIKNAGIQPRPSRVTAVWLIANTLLAGDQAEARYRNIALTSSTHTQTITPTKRGAA